MKALFKTWLVGNMIIWSMAWAVGQFSDKPEAHDPYIETALPETWIRIVPELMLPLDDSIS